MFNFTEMATCVSKYNFILLRFYIIKESDDDDGKLIDILYNLLLAKVEL